MAVTLNIINALCELYSLGLTTLTGGAGAFSACTVLSNTLALIASGIYLVSRRYPPLRKSADHLRCFATVCLSLTFLTVVFVLVPMMSHGDIVSSAKAMLLSREMVFHHLICPVLSFGSFVFWEDHYLRTKDAVKALVPTIMSGLVTGTANALGVMEGPYPFLRVPDQPWWQSVLWACLILSVNFLVAKMLVKAHKHG